MQPNISGKIKNGNQTTNQINWSRLKMLAPHCPMKITASNSKTQPKWEILVNISGFKFGTPIISILSGILFPFNLSYFLRQTSTRKNPEPCGKAYQEDPSSSPGTCLLSSWFFFCDLYFASWQPQQWQPRNFKIHVQPSRQNINLNSQTHIAHEPYKMGLKVGGGYSTNCLR